MGYFKNTAEGGTPDGNVSVNNSGGVSGVAFDTVVYNNSVANATTGNAAIRYTEAAALQGNLGIEITAQTATSYLRWTDPTPEPRGSVVRSYTHQAAPTGQLDLASIRCEGGGPLGETAGQAMVSLIVTTSGKVGIAPAGSNDLASLFTLIVGQTYIFEMAGEKGTTATNGKSWLRVYDTSGSILWDYSNTACNTRSSNAWQYRFGGVTTATGLTYDRMDSLQAGALASGFFGPLVDEARLLRVDFTTTGEPFSTATVTGVLEPGSPTPDTWAFAVSDGPSVEFSGTGSSRTFTVPPVLPPGDSLEVQVTVTKSGIENSKVAAMDIAPHTHWYRDENHPWTASQFA